MQIGKILIAVDKIETAIRDHKKTTLEVSNNIIKDEFKNIQALTSDRLILKLIFKVYYSWRVYSEHLTNENFKPGNPINIESIFADCSSIRAHITQIGSEYRISG